MEPRRILLTPLLFGLPGAGLPAVAQQPPAPPALTFALDARVEPGPPLEPGQVPRGRRPIIPIIGGSFEDTRSVVIRFRKVE